MSTKPFTERQVDDYLTAWKARDIDHHANELARLASIFINSYALKSVREFDSIVAKFNFFISDDLEVSFPAHGEDVHSREAATLVYMRNLEKFLTKIEKKHIETMHDFLLKRF